ncbi:MAG: bifunctional diguanylate cyclase/phosphodiesterase [Acidimicrobiia bacterium]|nr:bifunctional diguanylate cyclase/phosphodiesterase [Acidimicrobiia bacterium]
MDRDLSRQDRIGDRDRIAALSRVAGTAAGGDAVAAALAAVADEVVRLVADGCHVAVLAGDAGRLNAASVRHRIPATESIMRETLAAGTQPSEPGLIAAAATAGVSTFVPVVGADWKAELGDAGLGSVVCVPVVVDGDAVAVLVAMRARATPAFRDRDLDLLDEIGMWTALVLTGERTTRPTDAAAGVQTRRALHDPQTGLPNRMLFREHLHHACARGTRAGSSPAVLVVGVDVPAHVAGSSTNGTGDAVVTEMVRRTSSAVGASVIMGRVGTDELALLFEEVDAPEVPVRIAEELSVLLAEPVDLGHGAVAVTAGIGIAFRRPDSNEPPGVLLDHATRAADAARRDGSGRCVVFDSDVRELVTRRMRTEADLSRALAEGEFMLLYQPEVRLLTGEIVAVEALLRWRHPERGLLEPRDFLQAAEDAGLMVPIGAWALEEACRQQAEWTRLRRGRPTPAVVVNLSPRQLGDADLVADVAAVMARSGIEPGALCLDVTEAALVDDPVTALAALQAFRRLGVRVAVDDFGTGYASLSIVRSFPIDAVKIDRSVVAGLATDPAASGLCSAVIELAAGCGLDVSAEGVETPGQRDWLVAAGATRAQGDFFRAPSSPAQLGLTLALVPD